MRDNLYGPVMQHFDTAHGLMAATSGRIAAALREYGPYEIFTRSQNQYPANDLRKNFSTINYFDIKGTV